MAPHGMREIGGVVLASLVLAAAALVAGPARACLWDRDTLAAEAKGLPEVAAIIVGRFERNPPRYYEMRLARVEALLKDKPGDLAALDDAAVACDRLGRHDEAIGWMAKKREQLDAAPDKEHQYRYLANLGTFHAHRWFASGAKRDDMADLQKARELLDKAIALNPAAHFGREKYQLRAVVWILEQPTEQPGDIKLVKPLLAEAGAAAKGGGTSDAVRGLTGLIALGAAWQSVDLFDALARQLAREDHNSLALLAELRVAELRIAGRKSVHAPLRVMEGYRARGLEEDQKEVVDKAFKEGRAAAERWHENRLAFMQAKFEQGAHPDTHPDFWKGFEDQPKLPAALGSKRSGCGSCAVGSAAPAGAWWLAALVLLPLWRRRRTRRGF